MSNEHELSYFLTPLSALQRLIDHFHQRGVIIGGVATSIIGKPRLTADVDVMFLISKDDILQLVQEASNLGILPRITNAIEFGRENRVLLMRHQDSGINIDISIGFLPFEREMIERSQQKKIGDIIVQLPTPEDLIIMKAVAHRARDILDIEGIIETNSYLDTKRIKKYLTQYAHDLDMPEIWNDVESLLRKAQKDK